jgi:hypothetical protein
MIVVSSITEEPAGGEREAAAGTLWALADQPST